MKNDEKKKIENQWLASQLTDLCIKSIRAEKEKGNYLFAGRRLSASVKSIVSPSAAESITNGVAWDEAFTILKGHTLSAIVPIFLRGLFLGNIAPGRVSTATLVDLIEGNERSLVFDDLEEPDRSILAVSFLWLIRLPKFTEDQDEKIIDFVEKNIM